MSITQRLPFVPRLVGALMSLVLVLVVGTTFATAQSSTPVDTGVLTVPEANDGSVVDGARVTVRGSGFAPGASVQITIESEPILLATVTADATGSFETVVTIPAGMPSGTHTIKATGADATGGMLVLTKEVEVEGGSDTTLAVTGADILALTAVGGAAIAAGAGIVASRRRRA